MGKTINYISLYPVLLQKKMIILRHISVNPADNWFSSIVYFMSNYFSILSSPNIWRYSRNFKNVPCLVKIAAAWRVWHIFSFHSYSSYCHHGNPDGHHEKHAVTESVCRYGLIDAEINISRPAHHHDTHDKQSLNER